MAWLLMNRRARPRGSPWRLRSDVVAGGGARATLPPPLRRRWRRVDEACCPRDVARSPLDDRRARLVVSSACVLLVPTSRDFPIAWTWARTAWAYSTTAFAPASLRAPASRAALSRAPRALLELDPDTFSCPLAGALVAAVGRWFGRGAARGGAPTSRACSRCSSRATTPNFARKDRAASRPGVALPEPDALGVGARGKTRRTMTRTTMTNMTNGAAAQLERRGGADLPARGHLRRGLARMHRDLARRASAAACPAVEARCVFGTLAHAASKARDGAQNACGTPRASVVAAREAAADRAALAEATRAQADRPRRCRCATRALAGVLWIRAPRCRRIARSACSTMPAGSAAQPPARRGRGGRRASPRRRSSRWRRRSFRPPSRGRRARGARGVRRTRVWRRVIGGRGTSRTPCVRASRPSSRTSTIPTRGPERRRRRPARRECRVQRARRRPFAVAEASAARWRRLRLAARSGRSLARRARRPRVRVPRCAIAARDDAPDSVSSRRRPVRAPVRPPVDSNRAEAERSRPFARRATPWFAPDPRLLNPGSRARGRGERAAGRVASARNRRPTRAFRVDGRRGAPVRARAFGAELCASRQSRHRKRAFAGLEVARRVRVRGGIARRRSGGEPRVTHFGRTRRVLRCVVPRRR